MAHAFATLWELPVSGAYNNIGEAFATMSLLGDGPNHTLTVKVGPEKQDGVGGPFDSVSSFLRAWIHHQLKGLEE